MRPPSETGAAAAYERLRNHLRGGGVVILDGGVGSELERVGLPTGVNTADLWGINALRSHPELVVEVHRRFAEAGADVLTTDTWRIDAVLADEREGTLDRSHRRWRDQVQTAVDLAREGALRAGRGSECAIAFSLWPEPFDDLDLLKRLADEIARAGPDLILAETIETIPPDLRFENIQVLLGTGLPVWTSFRWCTSGPCDVRHLGIEPYHGRLQKADGSLFARAAGVLEGLGVDAVLVNCLPANQVPGTLKTLRETTSLPLGVYPNVGKFIDPGWDFDEADTVDSYLEHANTWRRDGASIIGGCCGTTAEHIAGIWSAFRSTGEVLWPDR